MVEECPNADCFGPTRSFLWRLSPDQNRAAIKQNVGSSGESCLGFDVNVSVVRAAPVWPVNTSECKQVLAACDRRVPARDKVSPDSTNTRQLASSLSGLLHESRATAAASRNRRTNEVEM